ncbi:hypothetical protein BCT85_13525 [Vibrio lentus]|nr:hypothetical protein BCT85_13525 [Vibrio lentus]
MSSKNYVASYKGKSKESPIFTFRTSGQHEHMDPESWKLALMHPTQVQQNVIVCTVKSSVSIHITDIIPLLGDEDSVVIKQLDSHTICSSEDRILIDVEGQGNFELNTKRIPVNLKLILRARVRVRLHFKQKDKLFSIASCQPLVPDLLEGIFFYDEQRHKMGGKRSVLGSFTSKCGTYKNLPCKMMLATLTESRVFSRLTEGFRLEVKIKFELDEDGEFYIVTGLVLPIYPETFEAEILSASLIEKDKSEDNLLVCDFSYFSGLISRVNITNKKLNVVAIEGPISFKVNLLFNATSNFRFTFLGLAVPSPFNAQVIPKELNPYPSEFEFVCFGLVIKVSVTRDSWEKYEASRKQVSFSGVSVPNFQLNKVCTLPVTHWQAKKELAEHNAWSPKVALFLNRLSLPDVIEDTVSYLTTEYRNGHLYYLFRRGEVDLHYPILAAEFFLYGIGGFKKGASIDLRIEKYSRYDSEKQEEYKAKHPRGSKRNEWSVQEVMSSLPQLTSSASDSYQEAYCVMEWSADAELMRLSNEYWSAFSTQRKNFAYCALTGHGDLYPLVAIPPLLLRKNDYFRLDTYQNIQVQVGSESVTLKDGMPEWRWAKRLVMNPQPHSDDSKQPEIKRLTCIEQKEVEPTNKDGRKRKKYLQLTLHDSGGKEYIYCSFKLGTYPLEDSELDKYEHLALCVGGDRVVEIIEMVRKNEA